MNRARVEDVIHSLRLWGEAYPVDMFRPPTPEEVTLATKAFPGLVDRLSAAMGRHIAKRMQDMADELQRAIDEEGQ